jgi:hypothetical protein
LSAVSPSARRRLVRALDVDRVLLVPREGVLARAVHARARHRGHVRRGQRVFSVLAQELGERVRGRHQASPGASSGASRPGRARVLADIEGDAVDRDGLAAPQAGNTPAGYWIEWSVAIASPASTTCDGEE